MKIKNKPIDNKLYTIYFSDGPLKGQTRSAIITRRQVCIPIPNNPFYKTAVYLVTKATNNFSEQIAVFSHCQKRGT